MSKRVLIVDDEVSVRKIVKRVLDAPGYEFLEAENGSQAIDIFRNEKLDMVITDLVMPGKNGIDLIMEIKKSKKPIPVIAISGGGGVTGRFNYLEIARLIGAENILNKPFENAELKTMSDAVLEEG